VSVVLCTIAGLVGSWVCFTMWELGVLTAAGFGGYSLAVWIMSMKEGLLIESYVTSSTFIAIISVVVVVAAWIFDEIAIVVASSISGAMALTLGVDCFLKWGLLQVLLAQVSEEFGKAHLTMKIYFELGGAAGLAVIGALVQFLTGANKGYGKSDRV